MRNKGYILFIILFTVIFINNCDRATQDQEEDDNSSTSYYQSGGTQNLANQTYSTTKTDENAVKVINSGYLTLTDSTITKSGPTASEENSNFYGTNAAVLAASASNINLTQCSITTSSSGANAVFAYGSSSSITLSNATISTTANSSRGVDATYGGTINISNSTITTKGDHCAALATDRYDNNTGAPHINAINCTGSTAGDGSPGIYCTGTFNIKSQNGGTSQYTATGSEAAVIEGLNSITLSQTNITGAKKWGVLIYQSMSGDAALGQGTFNMTDGTLTNNSDGAAFFICNTTAVINLSRVKIVNNSSTLIKATAPTGTDNTNLDWGNLGGTLTFSADGQSTSQSLQLEGNIILDSKSSIVLYLTGNSCLTSAINSANTASSVQITIDATSKWTATANSYIHTLTLSSIDNIDAQSGVIIHVGTLSGVSIQDGTQLPGGGYIQF